jgi:hypothetical protein
MEAVMDEDRRERALSADELDQLNGCGGAIPPFATWLARPAGHSALEARFGIVDDSV